MDLLHDKYVCPCCGYSCASEDSKASTPSNKEEPFDLIGKIAKAKTDLVEKCGLSVCKIYNEEENCLSTGSGWRGHEDYVITNAHVVESMSENNLPSSGRIVCEYSDKINLASRQKQEMKIIYFNREEDVAILTPKMGKIPFEVPILKISTELTHQGELVFTIGNPLHYRFTYTEGTVANPQYMPSWCNREFPVLQTTLSLNHGNSGGAVFNIKGEVVGMSTFTELIQDEKTNAERLADALVGNQEEFKLKEITSYGFCVTGIAIANLITRL